MFEKECRPRVCVKNNSANIQLQKTFRYFGTHYSLRGVCQTHLEHSNRCSLGCIFDTNFSRKFLVHRTCLWVPLSCKGMSQILTNGSTKTIFNTAFLPKNNHKKEVINKTSNHPIHPINCIKINAMQWCTFGISIDQMVLDRVDSWVFQCGEFESAVGFGWSWTWKKKLALIFLGTVPTFGIKPK